MNLLASLGLAVLFGAAVVGLLHSAVALFKSPKCQARLRKGRAD